MASFLSLTKIQLKSVLSAITFKNSSKNSRKFAIFVVALVALLMFSFGSMYIVSADAFSQRGMLEYMFLQAGIMGLFLILFLIAMSSQSHFFMARDYEMLSSLPIKNITIVASKFVAILVSAYIYTLITLLPAVVIYFVYAGFVFVPFITILLWLIFFPFLPSLIAVLFGLLFSYIISKAKNPQIITFVLCLLLVVVYFVYYLNFNSIITAITASSGSLVTALSIAMPSIGLVISSLSSGSVWAILIYVGINILALALAVLLTTSLYEKINLLFKNKKIAVSKKGITYEKTTVFKRLLINETRAYFSNAIWVLNTLLIALIGCAMPVVLYFSASTITAQFGSGMSVIAIIFLILMASLPNCNTSCVSVSLEGKKFALLKSLPLTPQKIITSKIVFNILLVVPFILLAGVLTFALFNQFFTPISAILLFVLPLIALVSNSIFGMIANLLFPKLNFTNTVQVVKQSASMLMGLLGGMMISILPFIAYMTFLSTYLSFDLFLILDLAYTIIFGLTCYFILRFKGEKLFNKIAC